MPPLADIVPLLVIPLVTSAMSSIDMPTPPAEIVPLLLMLPKNAPIVLTAMPVCFAEITPLLLMPPALLFPKAPVIFLTRIPAPNLLATFPLLLMPPPNVAAFLTTMALLPAEIVP
jgi:hypothetical protein